MIQLEVYICVFLKKICFWNHYVRTSFRVIEGNYCTTLHLAVAGSPQPVVLKLSTVQTVPCGILPFPHLKVPALQHFHWQQAVPTANSGFTELLQKPIPIISHEKFRFWSSRYLTHSDKYQSSPQFAPFKSSTELYGITYTYIYINY